MNNTNILLDTAYYTTTGFSSPGDGYNESPIEPSDQKYIWKLIGVSSVVNPLRTDVFQVQHFWFWSGIPASCIL
jgi:hypothetical protein